MKIKLFVLFLFCLGSISAQTFLSKINSSFETSTTKAEGTFKILAVLAEFQEDKDASTYGNGKFGSIYSKNYGSTILDPLPHDIDYFSRHLTFVKNYYKKVSKGKVDFEFTILPDVVTVSKTMRNYTPAGTSTNLKELGNFVREVWQKADTMSSVNFSDYDIFIIFHAGVGRDVSLASSLGNERDLPSVYLGDKTLRNIFTSDLSGLPLNRDGKYNSLIIPETDNREVESLTGTTLLEISINGLIVASIASHFGLPDLFDTKTGLSAIGRFGLMDGQSIFTYGGCFPPEPSPWEKIFLGWETPVEINPTNKNINVITDEISSAFDTVIVKIPISSSEYFLVENRSRDANKDGSTITYQDGSEIKTVNFRKDTSGFYSYDVDTLRGVVLDVDEFDWAVPGNGIVIWHIDDNVINANLETNTINTDKFKRGVDVEEADGIQDIGEQFTTIFGDQVVGEGDAADFWFKGNSSKLYKNRFDKNTYPNTNSNTGANSLVTLSDFSTPGTKMSFKLGVGDSLVKLNYRKSFDGILSGYKIFSRNEDFLGLQYLSAFDSVVSLNYSADILEISHISNPVYSLPVIFNLNGLQYYFQAGVTFLNSHITDNNNTFNLALNINEDITTDPLALKISESEYRIVVGTDKGKLFFCSPGNSNTNPAILDTLSIDPAYYVSKLAGTKDYFAAVAIEKNMQFNKYYFYDSGQNKVLLDGHPFDLAITKDQQGNFLAIVRIAYGFEIFKNGNHFQTIKLNENNFAQSFSLVDLKNDGNNYLVYSSSDKISAINLSGAQADGFPFVMNDDIKFSDIILAADFAGDNRPELIAFSTDGNVFAIDGSTGKLVDGFPISLGGQVLQSPTLSIDADNSILHLSVLDSNYGLYDWTLGGNNFKVYWGSVNKDNLNSSFVPAASGTNAISTFFPKERAYNWPNPVYDGTTNIRYYVSEDSKINIKIFDLAGDYVAELNDDAIGGLDNETVWNVNTIQSGVYFARIQAVGNSGKSENAVIKIAVIK